MHDEMTDGIHQTSQNNTEFKVEWIEVTRFCAISEGRYVGLCDLSSWSFIQHLCCYTEVPEMTYIVSNGALCSRLSLTQTEKTPHQTQRLILEYHSNHDAQKVDLFGE